MGGGIVRLIHSTSVSKCPLPESPDWLTAGDPDMTEHKQGWAAVTAHVIGRASHKCTYVTTEEVNAKWTFLKRKNSEFRFWAEKE